MGRSTICCHQFVLDCQRWEEVRFVATSLCSTVGRSTICPVCAERWEKVRFVATSLQCSIVKDGKKFDLLPPVCARLPKMGRSTIGCHQFVLKDGKKYDLLPAVCARVSKMGKSRVRGAVGVHVFQRFALRSRLMKHVIRTYVHNNNRLPLLAYTYPICMQSMSLLFRSQAISHRLVAAKAQTLLFGVIIWHL